VSLTSARPNSAQTLLATASSACSTGPTARLIGLFFRQSRPSSTFALSAADLTSKRAKDAASTSDRTSSPSRWYALMTAFTASAKSNSPLASANRSTSEDARFKKP
jgi:hypothetical protein